MMDANAIMAWTITVWLWATAALIVYRLLTGQIRSNGLLRTGSSEHVVEPERVQLFIGSIAAAGLYVGYVLNAAADSAKPLTALPDIPTEAVLLMGGSNLLYLGGKYVRAIIKGET